MKFTIFGAISFLPVILFLPIGANNYKAALDYSYNDVQCSLTFNKVNQDYECCNTIPGEEGCVCVELQIDGLYDPACAYSTFSFWWDSPYLCDYYDYTGGNKYQPNNPNPILYLDLDPLCLPQCNYVDVPVTLYYSVNYGPQLTYTTFVRLFHC